MSQNKIIANGFPFPDLCVELHVKGQQVRLWRGMGFLPINQIGFQGAIDNRDQGWGIFFPPAFDVRFPTILPGGSQVSQDVWRKKTAQVFTVRMGAGYDNFSDLAM